MEKGLRRELLDVIDRCRKEAINSGSSVRPDELIEDVIGRNSRLWKQVQEAFARERLGRIINAALARASESPDKNQQLRFEGAGFPEARPMIRLEDNSYVATESATREQLLSHKRWYVANQARAAEQRDNRQRHADAYLRTLERMLRVSLPFDRKTPGIAIGVVFSYRIERNESRKSLRTGIESQRAHAAGSTLSHQ